MKKYLVLVSGVILFVGCTPQTQPIDPPAVEQTIEVGETRDAYPGEESVGAETKAVETNDLDDTSDLFGEESDVDVSL